MARSDRLTNQNGSQQESGLRNTMSNEMQVVRYNLLRSLVAATLLCLSGCIADPNLQGRQDQVALLEAYRAQTERNSAQRVQNKQDTIRRIEVTTDPRTGNALLSVDLGRANLRDVVARILDSPLLQYASEGVAVSGTVSARFEDQPLLEGLNAILASSGVYVEDINGVLTFQSGLSGDELDLTSEEAAAFVSQEVLIRHLSSEDVVTLIEELFPFADFSDEEGLTASNIQETNSVYLAGPAFEVAQALSIIAKADRPVAHVIIEALVVDINTSSIETLGLSFEDAASGKFSIASLIPGQTGGNIVATFSDLASDSAQVTATIDFLAARNAAQVLARPYIATRSMQPASISIVDDQFVRVSTADTSVVSTDSITAGISMEITPAVMADDSIRIDLTLEDSRFGATAGEVLLTKQRNSASTSMIVGSGQTIMIGGLNSHYRISEKEGIPWLRHVPVLNAFAGKQGALERRTELVVYVTPYIWIPGMDIPLPLQGTPDPDISRLLSVEKGGHLD
ncbi:MAG: type II secretion system protein GspD [Henriciella sp.]